MSSREKLELALSEALIEKHNNENYNENIFLDNLLRNSINNIKISGNRVTVDLYEFEIDRKLLRIIDGLDNVEEIIDLNNQGLIGKINNLNVSGLYDITVDGKTSDGTEESVTYKVHLIVKDQSIVFDGINSIDGIELNDKTYEVGDKTQDVATASTNAEYMVVLKVNGDITINNGVTLTACKSEQGYGGPKGMMIFCTGNIINNGKLSMTARGAKAEGQNVYIWENSDGTFEYVPAVGGNGGASISNNSITLGLRGNAGENGIGRQTGGGASGGAWNGDEGSTSISGKGAKGTSYSGGSGGGAIDHNSFGETSSASNAEENGGAGGAGRGRRASSSWVKRYASGGAGNPGGYSGQSVSLDGLGNISTPKAEDGTGGLLIVYSRNIENNGIIESNGSKSVSYGIEGGSSGGGSINIFYSNKINNLSEVIEANGGSKVGSYGGAGGNGTVNIGKLSKDGYIADVNKREYNDLFKKINIFNLNGYYNFRVNGKTIEHDEETVTYSSHIIVHNGDMVLDGVNVFQEMELNNNVYEVGDKTKDVATANSYATNTVILKINGNLTINEGITLTACKSDQGYGGPKGLIIYCTGSITNNGKLSMTARGAKAEGQNVYMWENSDGTFEYVPAVGGKGGDIVVANKSEQYIAGNAGNNGVARQTGGGASGGAQSGDCKPTSYSGTGATGTSYSGGAGGGAICQNIYGSGYGGNAGVNGGSGGAGRGARESSGWATRYAGGGAGNPGGYSGFDGTGNITAYKGEDGTGGLLIVYSRNIENNGIIESNGSKAVDYGRVQGGSSGAGSINIFYEDSYVSSGSISANGGEKVGGFGGAGGDGAISIGKIQEGTYIGTTIE